MYFLTLLFIVMVTTTAQARLGETADQLVTRYDQPLSEVDQKGGGGKIPLVKAVFQKNGFEIDVSLSEGLSVSESFKKINGNVFTVGEVRTLLTANSQGFGWEAPTEAEGQKSWKRDDGAVATLLGGRVLNVVSKDLLNKQAIARKLAHQPSLEGF
jgi:hypothetical protein